MIPRGLTRLDSCATLLPGNSFMRRFGLPAFVPNCLTLSLLLVSLTLAALAQLDGPSVDSTIHNRSVTYITAPGTGVVVATVYSEKMGALLDRQVLLQLLNRSTHLATWQTTEEVVLGGLQDRVSQAGFTNVAYGDYDLEVSAVGYLSE